MADSDNTTTLPFVTKRWRGKRRPVDDGGAGVPGRGLRGGVFAGVADEPVLALLEEWRQAHRLARVLCFVQQRQERRLLRGDGDTSGADDLQRRHEEARAAEIDAMAREEDVLARLAETPAQSLAGVLAKLEIIVAGSESRAEGDVFPWPQLRSALTDLRGLACSAEHAGCDADDTLTGPPRGAAPPGTQASAPPT